MIPKSLILSFLALQGPGMGPSSRGAKDVVIFGDVTAAPQEVMKLGHGGFTSWSLHAQSDKQADFSTYPVGKWPEDTKVNGDFTVNSNPNQSWLYSLMQSFPKLPSPPGRQDHVLGGSPVNSRLRLHFDVARKDTVVYILYVKDDSASEASITTQFPGESGFKPQHDHLEAGWNQITYLGSYKTFDITVDAPEPQTHLLLAQVNYSEEKA